MTGKRVVLLGGGKKRFTTCGISAETGIVRSKKETPGI